MSAHHCTYYYQASGCKVEKTTSLFFFPKENLILSSPNPWEGGLSRDGTAGPRKSGQKVEHSGTSLRSSLRLHAFIAKGMGSIPDWGTKIPHAPQHNLKLKYNNNNKKGLCGPEHSEKEGWWVESEVQGRED